jgi:hypothetical protein
MVMVLCIWGLQPPRLCYVCLAFVPAASRQKSAVVGLSSTLCGCHRSACSILPPLAAPAVHQHTCVTTEDCLLAKLLLQAATAPLLLMMQQQRTAASASQQAASSQSWGPGPGGQLLRQFVTVLHHRALWPVRVGMASGLQMQHALGHLPEVSLKCKCV